jgi:hypothetical protein
MSGPATIGGTVASAKPANQVCPICGYDDDVETILADDEWGMTCASRSHPPFEWRPKEQYHKPLSPRSGIGEELGVYDDLIDCVDDAFAEFGIVEYRFWERAPKTYTILVERYGHTVYGPSKYHFSVPGGRTRTVVAGATGGRRVGPGDRLLVL